MSDAPTPARPWTRTLRRWAAAGLVLVAWDYAECNLPKLAEQRIAVRDLPAGTTLRLLHLSDIHDKLLPGGNARFLADLGAQRPDAIVVTGDLIDHTTKDLARAFAWAEGLKVVSPKVFWVPGNHEHWSGRLAELAAGLAARGVTVLVNRHAPLVPGVEVVGVDDAYTGADRLDLATAGLDPRGCAIAITHAPELVDRLGDAPVDLVLAGHTHGGQVRVPGVGALVAPGQGFCPRWDKGLYDLPGRRKLYIDSGLGTSIAPLRFFNRAQASVLTLVPE